MSGGYTKLRHCTRVWRRVLSPTQWGLVCVAIDQTEGWQRDSAPISYLRYAEEANVSRSTAKSQVQRLVSSGPLNVVGEVVVETEEGPRPVKVYKVDYEWSPATEKVEEIAKRRARERAYKRTRRERKEEPLKRGRPRRGQAGDPSEEDGRGLTENPQEKGGRGLNKNPRRGLTENPQGGYLKTPSTSQDPLADAESGGPKERKETFERKTDLPSVGLSGDRPTNGWVKLKEKVESMDAVEASPAARRLGGDVRRSLARAKLDVPIEYLRCLAELLGGEARVRMERVARKNVRHSRKTTVDDPWSLYVSSVWSDLEERPSGPSQPPNSGGEGKVEGPVEPELQEELLRLDRELGADGVLGDATAKRDPVTGGLRVVPLNAEHAEVIRESVGDRLTAAGWRLAGDGGGSREDRKTGEVA